MVLCLVLLSFCPPSPDIPGRSPARVCQALWLDDTSVLNTFLQQPCDPDLNVDGSLTCLCFAAKCGSLKCARLLLEAKADLNKSDEQLGRTPLHWACARGHVNVTRWLLESGADRSQAEAGGLRLLQMACYNGHLRVVRALVEVAADVNAEDVSGYTPLVVATVVGDIDVLRFLIEHGADTDKVTSRGTGALGMACIGGQTDVVRVLVQHGVDGNQAMMGTQRVSPLVHACYAGHAGIVQLLLESGADPNDASPLRAPPLHVACQRGHLDVARLLVQGRARLDTTVEEQTALDIARAAGHPDIVALLVEAMGEGREPKRRRRTKGPP